MKRGKLFQKLDPFQGWFPSPLLLSLDLVQEELVHRRQRLVELSGFKSSAK